MASFIVHELSPDVPWHLSAFFPNYKMMNHEATGVKTLQRAKNIALEEGLKYVYLGNVAVNGDTHCPACDTLMIDRSDYHVTTNKLDDGHCPYCNEKIEGVWS
jgi:pyruvate formate lyase activating enzyme